MNLITKIFLAILLLVILTITFLNREKFYQEAVLNFINQKIPWGIPLFSFVREQVTSGTLIGIALFLTFANIPLLPSPPGETYVVYAYNLNKNLIGTLLVVTSVFLIFAAIYYSLGYLFGHWILEKITKRHVGYNKILARLAPILIFLTYLLPLPFSPATFLTLLFGTYRTGFRSVVIAAALGISIRFLLLLLFFQQISGTISTYLNINITSLKFS